MQLFFDKGIANHDLDAETSYWLLVNTLQVSSEVAERTDEHLNIDYNLLSEYQKNDKRTSLEVPSS